MPDVPPIPPPDDADGDLDDRVLRARLGSTADAVTGGPWVDGDARTERALAATLAGTARRRRARRLQVVLPVAAALVVVLVLARFVMTSHDDAVSVGTGGSTATADRDGPTGTAGPGTTGPAGTTAPGTDPRGEPAGSTTTTIDPTRPTGPTTTVRSAPGVTTPDDPPPGDDPGAPDTTDTTSTTTPLDGTVSAELVPQASAVRVGDRLLVDAVVRNGTAAEIGYTRGSSSCPSFGQVVAGLTDGHELPVDYAGNPLGGVGVKMADLVAQANQLTSTWSARPPVELEFKDAHDGYAPACTANLTIGHIGPGETARTTLAFDADVPPGPVPRTTIAVDLTFPYWTGDHVLDPGDGTGLVVRAHTTVDLIDEPARDANLGAVYQAIDADSRVRGILDATPDQQYLAWAGYHHGRLVFRAIPFLLAGGPGGPGLYVEADPSTAAVLVVRATSQP